MCVGILLVCCQSYPAVLRGLSTLQFLVFLTAKRSCSDRLGSFYRVQSQRWELAPDPAHWDQRGGCFLASGHDGLKEVLIRRKHYWNTTSFWGKEFLLWIIACTLFICVFVYFRPIFSEWRCERPHIVCSSRLIGFRSGKRAGFSTYYKKNGKQKHPLVML